MNRIKNTIITNKSNFKQLQSVYENFRWQGQEKTGEYKVMEIQSGFRWGRSCIDQVLTIRQLSEKVPEKNGQMAVEHV